MKTQLGFGFASVIAMVAAFSSAGQDLAFDAAAGEVVAPFTISTNGSISQPSLTGLANGGRAVYIFTIASDGEYAVVAEVCAPDDASNSLYVNIDGELRDPEMIWDIPVTTGFAEKRVGWRGTGTASSPQYAGKNFQLTPGSHRLIIGGKEPDTQVKRLRIVKQPPPPAPSPPQPPTNLRIVGQQ
ncbi:MAG TPA: hypothetical protein VJA21_27730 [Verrucomicrobiae bacterium]